MIKCLRLLNNSMKLLLVEDNPDLNNAITQGLKARGYNVESMFDGEEALDKTRYTDYDLGILDLNLPSIDGITLAKEIRKNGLTMPLIALTARDTIKDKLKGFETGFDDYLTKPFEFAELVARIESLIRRSKPNSEMILRVDNVILSPGERSVKVDKKEIVLTKIEFNMLEYLLRKKGLVVSSSELIEHVWSEEPDLVDPPIRTHIKNLRRKIGDTKFEKIKTIAGIGYKIDN